MLVSRIALDFNETFGAMRGTEGKSDECHEGERRGESKAD